MRTEWLTPRIVMSDQSSSSRRFERSHSSKKPATRCSGRHHDDPLCAFAQNDGGAVTTAWFQSRGGCDILVWNRRTRGGAAAHYGLCPRSVEAWPIRRGPQATNRLIFCYLGLKKASSLRVWRLLVRQISCSTACQFGVY